MGKKTTLAALEKTRELAREKERLCYLYKGDNGYWNAFQYQSDWLFQAYPGGREIFSVRGGELISNL